MNEIIFFSGNDEGAINTFNSTLNKGKEVMSKPEDIKNNCERFQEVLLQTPSRSTIVQPNLDW